MSATPADAPPAIGRSAFLLRKLHSLSGVIPIGGFLCMHLFENYSAVHGAKAFDDTVTRINSLPFILALEVGAIWLPLAFHALLGMVIVFEGKPNPLAYPYARNWMYTLQRATGVLALAFIVFHFVNFRGMARADFLPEIDGRATGNSPFGIVRETLANPAVLAFYVVGLASVVFHFANGVWGFLCSWGLVVGPRAQRLAAWACAGIGLAVMGLGTGALLAFVPGSPTWHDPGGG